jgi:HAD superfamily hydrolase (TIGR01549 family)
MARPFIIFDVDGVLLNLTKPEEDLFFEPFIEYLRPDLISYDWNSYAVRNDEDILAELVTRHNLPESKAQEIKSEYLKLVAIRNLQAIAIDGAAELLQHCSKFATLGIATANFIDAAKLRLERAKLWPYVSAHAFGADGGGAKTEILGRALATLKAPLSEIIYIGDNLNDVEAGLSHHVQFIGFSEDVTRLDSLKQAGATHLSQNHKTTIKIIGEILKL